MKYTERDSFLFGMTLTELTFIIFMIFLLFFMNHLHEKQLEIEKQAEQNSKLIIEINAQKQKIKVCEDILPLVEQDPDKFFSMLAEHPELVKEINELKNENADLKKRNNMCSAITKAFEDYNQGAPPDQQIKPEDLPGIISAVKGLQSIAPDLGIDPKKTTMVNLPIAIRNRIGDLQGQFVKIEQECKGGFGPPPCWLREEDGKNKAEYIYAVVINESTLDVKRNWPADREIEVDGISGARDILQDSLSIAEFRKLALPILKWSKVQNPECRHYVQIVDHAETKDSFKRKLLTIEEYFYKYLPASTQLDKSESEILLDTIELNKI